MKSRENLSIFNSKSRKIGKFVIHGFQGSRKWWNVKLRSYSIHVNFYHDPSLINNYGAHELLFLMFDLLQTNGQTRKSIYLLQVDLICPGSSLRHKTLIEKGIKRPQQRRPFMICWTLWGTWPLGLSWKDYKVTLKAILPTIWRWKCINWCKIWCTSEMSTVLLERPWLSKIFSKLFLASQCGNSKINLLVRFYVKSKLASFWELPFWSF